MKFYVYRLALKHRFRGLDYRDGLLLKGERWAEVSPFWDYDDAESLRWLAAGVAASRGFPTPRRIEIPVNETIPEVAAETAYELASAAQSTTFKVKIAGPNSSIDADIERLEAVRSARPAAKIRVDVNGAWQVDEAIRNITLLDRAAGLEYVEQPCATVSELAQVRRKVSVPIAADESLRRSPDPLAVVRAQAADIAVLKNQPLGGVEKALDLAADLGLPVVVSSALESAIGLQAGLAFAAALDELPYACGLATSRLFVCDLARLETGIGTIFTSTPQLQFEESLPVSDELAAAWEQRLARLWELGNFAEEYEFMGGLSWTQPK